MSNIDINSEIRTQQQITDSGNPRKPTGDDGQKMLERMNESHYAVTGWALEHWNINESDIILDIGCGGGATLKRMSDSVVSGHLTGVDYSSTSVEMSKETNYDSVKSGKTDIIEASVECLPFLDNSFDKIITVESFYFWPHPQENLKEVYRVLKTDGTFLLVADIYGKDGLDVQILENIKKFNLYNTTPDEYKKLFEIDHVDLEFEDDALDAIVDKAIERKTGARGLRSILEEIMRDIMFEIPSNPKIEKCIITKDTIKKGGKPELIINENRNLEDIERPKRKSTNKKVETA